MAQSIKKPPAMQETWIQSLGWEDLLEKGWQLTPVFSSGESHEQGSQEGCSPWGPKELDTTEGLTLSHRDYFKWLWSVVNRTLGFPFGSVVKNPPARQEMQVLSLGWEDHLKKEMAAHFNILAWKIPWTEEPGYPWDHKRVGHSLAT